MEYLLKNNGSRSMLFYTSGNDLYSLSLPPERIIRPALVHRGYISDFQACTYENTHVLLFRTREHKIVLIHPAEHAVGLQETTLLDCRNTSLVYKDLTLQNIQGKLFFFYTVYDPETGACDLQYKLPLEQLVSKTIASLTPAETTAESEKQPVTAEDAAGNTGDAADDAGDTEEEQAAFESPEEPIQSEPAYQEATDPPAPAPSQEDLAEMERLRQTITHITAQYNELYDYATKLQREAKKWKHQADLTAAEIDDNNIEETPDESDIKLPDDTKETETAPELEPTADNDTDDNQGEIE